MGMKSMKAMKALKSNSKVMTKGALVRTLAEQHEMKTKVCAGLLESLATLATTEVKKTGIFTIPGLCRIKTRETCHQGRSEDGLRSGDEGEGEASQDCRQGFP